MSTLRALSNRFQAAVAAYDGTLQEAIEETKDVAVAFNRQQLYSGIKSTGDKITPHYANLKYAAKKYGLNATPGFTNPDLYVTGAFYLGIGVVVNQKSLTFDSTDSKAPKLELEYTPQIYGLTKENKSAYSLESVKPVLFAKIKAQTTG